MKKSFILIAVLFYYLHLISGEYKIISYRDFGEGSVNFPLDLLMDNDGFLWVATETGVLRFDGHEFTYPIKSDSVQRWHFNKLVLGGNNSIFAAGPNGIVLIKGLNFFPYVEKSLKISITDIAYDDYNDLLYVVTSGNRHLLYIYNNDCVLIDSTEIDEPVSVLAVTSSHLITGNLFGNISIYEKNSLKGGSAKVINIIDKYNIGGTVKSILPDGKNLYLGINGHGIFIVEDYTNDYKIDHLDFLGEEAGADIKKDIVNPERYWAGSLYNGAFYFSRNRLWQHYTRANGLASINVVSVLPDSMGRVWFGTQFGLSVIKNMHIQNLLCKHGETAQVVWVVAEVNDNLWVGTENGIWEVVNDNGNLHVKRPKIANILNNETIFNIFQASDGSIWVTTGAAGKIYRYKGNKWIIYGRDSGIPNSKLTKIYEDKEKRIWIAGSKLICFDQDELKILNPPLKFPDLVSYDIVQLNDGTIVYGFSHGVIATDGNKVWELPGTIGRNFNVSAFYYDKKTETLLISALGKVLKRWQKGVLANVGYIDQISGKEIYSINYIEGKGYFFGTDAGITIFDEKNNKWNYISPASGLSDREINSYSTIYFKDRLWVGTANGLNKIDLKILQYKPHGDFIYLKGIFLDGKPLIANDSMKYFSYKVKNVSFKIGVKSFFEKKRLKFMFKMEGIDKQFKPSEYPVVNYSNLEYGKHTLYVKSVCSITGLESKTHEIKFYIYPAWWQTIYAKVIFLLLVLILFWLLFRIRYHYLNYIIKKLQKNLSNERKKVIENENILNVLYNHSTIGIVVLSLDGMILVANKPVLKFLNCKNNIEGLNFSEIKVLKDNLEIFRALHIIKKRPNKIIEISLNLPEKEKQYYLRFLNIPEDAESRIVVIITDVSDFMKAKSLDIKMESYNQIFATLSHYLNNTMTIMGLAVQKYYMHPQEGAEHMGRLVDYSTQKISFILKLIEEKIRNKNIKLTDYVGAKDMLFDIEENIKEFDKKVRKSLNLPTNEDPKDPQ